MAAAAKKPVSLTIIKSTGSSPGSSIHLKMSFDSEEEMKAFLAERDKKSNEAAINAVSSINKTVKDNDGKDYLPFDDAKLEDCGRKGIWDAVCCLTPDWKTSAGKGHMIYMQTGQPPGDLDASTLAHLRATTKLNLLSDPFMKMMMITGGGGSKDLIGVFTPCTWLSRMMDYVHVSPFIKKTIEQKVGSMMLGRSEGEMWKIAKAYASGTVKTLHEALKYASKYGYEDGHCDKKPPNPDEDEDAGSYDDEEKVEHLVTELQTATNTEDVLKPQHAYPDPSVPCACIVNRPCCILHSMPHGGESGAGNYTTRTESPLIKAATKRSRVLAEDDDTPKAPVPAKRKCIVVDDEEEPKPAAAAAAAAVVVTEEKKGTSKLCHKCDLFYDNWCPIHDRGRYDKRINDYFTKKTTTKGPLTPGTIDRLIENDGSILPCQLQVLELKRIGGYRARVVLSDGESFIQGLLNSALTAEWYARRPYHHLFTFFFVM